MIAPPQQQQDIDDANMAAAIFLFLLKNEMRFETGYWRTGK